MIVNWFSWSKIKSNACSFQFISFKYITVTNAHQILLNFGELSVIQQRLRSTVIYVFLRILFSLSANSLFKVQTVHLSTSLYGHLPKLVRHQLVKTILVITSTKFHRVTWSDFSKQSRLVLLSVIDHLNFPMH